MKKIKIAIIDTGCSTKLLNQNINIIYDEKLQLSVNKHNKNEIEDNICLLYTSPSPRDA